jgi:hypothetical protein
MSLSNTTTAATQYHHLELRPGSNYRQMFLKDRRIRAAIVDFELKDKRTGPRVKPKTGSELLHG